MASLSTGLTEMAARPISFWYRVKGSLTFTRRLAERSSLLRDMILASDSPRSAHSFGASW